MSEWVGEGKEERLLMGWGMLEMGGELGIEGRKYWL